MFNEKKNRILELEATVEVWKKEAEDCQAVCKDIRNLVGAAEGAEVYGAVANAVARTQTYEKTLNLIITISEAPDGVELVEYIKEKMTTLKIYKALLEGRKASAKVTKKKK